jgi:putative exosortase-associated protein (TIGR04073 family)
MGDANREKGFFAGMTWGILHGAADTVIRACVGVFEVVTFPFPIPEGYSPVLKDPEYFLKDFN